MSNAGFSGRRLVALVALTVGLAACGDAGMESAGEGGVKHIEGQVIYRERMRLPPAAEVEVELQDVSRADAPASTMATVMMPARQGPPYAFSIEYQAADIEPRHRYALRASITLEGRLLFTSNEYIDPFAGEGPVEILVQRVPESVSREAAAAEQASALEGTTWILATLRSQLRGPGVNGSPVTLVLDAGEQRASGFSGCNRYTGTYQREGQAEAGSPLTFGPLAGTLMACEDEAQALERDYQKAMITVDAYRLEGDALTLLAGGEEVATFTAGEA